MSESAAIWPDKDPLDKLDYAVDFEPALTRFWLRGTTFSSTVRVRPTKANGFEYECTTSGQTGSREPSWPTTIAATVTSGGAVFTCRAVSTSSLITTISGTPTWTADAGVTISGETVTGQMAVAAIAGGKDGEDYAVIVTATCADATIHSKVCVLPVRRAIA